ncbi:type III-B CRISPR module RAMP protein Cmr1 [Thermoanaerobacter thermocopriae]|uniref:type III-B CRISPR module RAMP protein Cmr1 n=1 Tax=Thermoanaerobacter thermocopriae TaxID=29350 RepID=UPI000490DD60|nr:type III-B CRISPR module RAMP protein Cmr1 [Thermoanaerobacter thermocopriae]
MNKKEVTVHLETITPLWTGDAWQENSNVRPSSLMGSLRFWFSVYWKAVKNGNNEKLNNNNVVADNLGELENPKEERTLKQIFLKRLLREGDNKSFDNILDESLEDLGLSVPSRLFGCTGWKSRVDIEISSFIKQELNFREIDFNFPFKENGINTEHWIKSVLFQRKDSKIVLHKDVKLLLKTTEYWWDNYLSGFFNFYKDKIIFVGGKLSFGFGLVNIRVEGEQNDKEANIKGIKYNDIMRIHKIEKIKYDNRKKVLGYNFKYFLRREEEMRYRKRNFGEQGAASSIYVSNLIENDDYHVYLINFNNPFDNKKVPDKIFSKYQKLLFNHLKSRGDRNG